MQGARRGAGQGVLALLGLLLALALPRVAAAAEEYEIWFLRLIFPAHEQLGRW